MLKSIIRRAVEASFSTYEFACAVVARIDSAIDYEEVADRVLGTIDTDELVTDAAVEYAIDILDLP